MAEVFGGEIGVLLHAYSFELHAIREPGFDALPEKDHQRLDRRNRLPIRELRFGIVDMLVIETVYDLLLEDAVEQIQIQHHGRVVVERSGDGHGAFVIVAVPRRIGARSKDLAVSVITPLRTIIPVRCAELDRSGEMCGGHDR